MVDDPQGEIVQEIESRVNDLVTKLHVLKRPTAAPQIAALRRDIRVIEDLVGRLYTT